MMFSLDRDSFLQKYDPTVTFGKHLELFRFNAHLVSMIDSNLEEVEAAFVVRAQSKLIRFPKAAA